MGGSYFATGDSGKVSHWAAATAPAAACGQSNRSVRDRPLSDWGGSRYLAYASASSTGNAGGGDCVTGCGWLSGAGLAASPDLAPPAAPAADWPCAVVFVSGEFRRRFGDDSGGFGSPPPVTGGRGGVGGFPGPPGETGNGAGESPRRGESGTVAATGGLEGGVCGSRARPARGRLTAGGSERCAGGFARREDAGIGWAEAEALAGFVFDDEAVLANLADDAAAAVAVFHELAGIGLGDVAEGARWRWRRWRRGCGRRGGGCRLVLAPGAGGAVEVAELVEELGCVGLHLRDLGIDVRAGEGIGGGHPLFDY